MPRAAQVRTSVRSSQSSRSRSGVPDVRRAVAAAADAARAVGAAFVLNPAPARSLPAALIAGCTVLTPNQHEVGLLGPGGVPGLLEQGAGAVVVTEGAAGATLHRPGRPPWHQPAFAVEVADTTGAGDAFTGALAAVLSAGRDLLEAVRVGVRAGSYAVGRPGAQASFASLTALGLDPLRVRG